MVIKEARSLNLLNYAKLGYRSPDMIAVGIWQLGQYLRRRFIPLLYLLTVLWPLQWLILLLFNYYCLAIV